VSGYNRYEKEVTMFAKFETHSEAKASGKPFVWFWIGDDEAFCEGSFEEVMANLLDNTTFMLYGEWVLSGHKYNFPHNEEVPEFYTPLSEEQAHFRALDFYAPYVQDDGESRTIAGELGISYEEYMGIDVRFDDDF
jgi:hypothetical protein